MIAATMVVVIVIMILVITMMMAHPLESPIMTEGTPALITIIITVTVAPILAAVTRAATVPVMLPALREVLLRPDQVVESAALPCRPVRLVLEAGPVATTVINPEESQDSS